MTFKFKKPRTEGSLWKGIAVGTGLALLLTVAGCALSAWGISTQRIPENGIAAAAAVTAVISAGVGAGIASQIAGQKRMQVCLLTTAVYFLCLLSMTALFFDGKYSGVGSMALAVLAVSLILHFRYYRKRIH